MRCYNNTRNNRLIVGDIVTHTNPLSLEILTGLFRTSPKDAQRIINREGTTIEFKETYNHGSMAQYFRAIAAFANNSGGYILFGVGDKPRRLLGLKEKSLRQFEELKVDEFTKNLLDYFSPEIKWDHCTFEFHEMSFGVIYIYPLMHKPCICKKHYDDTNPKYTLKEGDIYYRYGGRSERIRYEELSAIIDESRKAEERQWLKFAKKAAKIGVSNAALLDLNTGNLSGTGGSVFLGADLLKKIAFIQEGKFVETGGIPTLRVIGDVTDIKTGKVVVTETTKKIVRAIEPGDIVQAFLENQPLDEPLEYVKRICSCTSANYPVYFFLQQAQKNTTDAIALIKASSVRGNTKLKLTERLEGKYIDSKKVPRLNTEAARDREVYRLHWLSENMPEDIIDINRCVEAILYLTNKSIYEHQQYIRSVMLRIFNRHYANASSSLASAIRLAICKIDEAIHLET